MQGLGSSTWPAVAKLSLSVQSEELKMEGIQDIPVLESAGDETSKVSEKPELFSEVRRKRKRQKVSDMDTEDDGPATQDTGEAEERLKEAPAKRPVFPPVDASTIVVSKNR